MIKHISFDLWLTLIRSHPEFKAKRAFFLHKEYNPGRFSVREIMEIVRHTDLICDRLNEMNGKKVPTDQMYLRVLLQLGNQRQIISDDLHFDIKAKVHELFIGNLPDFLNGSIVQMLQTLKSDGYSMNISSNTGYIEGPTMLKTLNLLGISEYFVFCIFSDEIGASKPSMAFFDQVFEKVSVQKGEVLHVGDNHKADYEGARSYGFNALHIDNQQYTINDIKKYL